MTPDRFFSLLLALQARPVTTAPALAGEIGVSVRTIIRDLNWLAEAGFPVLTRQGRHGGVSLLPGSTLDATRLTSEEREHLTLTGLDDDQRRRLGIDTASNRAIRKVATERTGDELLPLGDLVVSDNRPWFGSEPEGVTPAAIIGDLRRGMRLKITYRRFGREPSTRTINPYGLLAKAGRWYLVADENSAPRLFALQRLLYWEVLRTRRRLRPGANLARVANELTSTWETAGHDVIDLLISEHQVERAVRILGTRLTLGKADDTGHVSAALKYNDLEDVRQLLAFGAAVTVLNPPEAKQRIVDLAQEITDHYR
ncbi:helix-turn-helix transcriptional regulator [Nesterenkonia ebinurensis]|uniref:helix-turn-helix transcriptional regulator n=1 Tax=Nesterenkonia ebinurensis TaxID=2608252 RepID=UPI00123DF030|nr:WYL domain-containing protein [Nesterenkonia ebinurensis]